MTWSRRMNRGSDEAHGGWLDLIAASSAELGDQVLASELLQVIRDLTDGVLRRRLTGHGSRFGGELGQGEAGWRAGQRKDGCQCVLLADYLKAILLDHDLPADLRAQAQGSRFLAQYCPVAPSALCRPSEMEATTLSFAFETG